MKKVVVTVGGLPSTLLVAFVVLKLCHVITWPWVWVLSPLWIPWALGLTVFITGMLIYGLFMLGVMLIYGLFMLGVILLVTFTN